MIQCVQPLKQDAGRHEALLMQQNWSVPVADVCYTATRLTMHNKHLSHLDPALPFGCWPQMSLVLGRQRNVLQAQAEHASVLTACLSALGKS